MCKFVLASAKIDKVCVMSENKVEILKEMREALEAARRQLAALEDSVERLEAVLAAEPVLGAAFFEAPAMESPVEGETPVPEAPVEPEIAPEPDIAPETAPESEIAPEAELALEPEIAPEAELAPEPVIALEPEAAVEPETPVFEPEASAEPETSVFEPEASAEPETPAPAPESERPAPAVIDALMERCAWKTDIPGSPVRNILSAISLNDRLLFINTLFGEDAAKFQKTISLFNSLTSLAEAETYIRSEFPNWDLNSDSVYRFMMAVRRKLV